MKRILVLFAHPRFEKSRINRSLLDSLPISDRVTRHDLYELYPDFNIDVAAEQRQLLAHDVLVWQYPFYMYGAPALLKQWLDMVLEYGWAHGQGGDFLKGKTAFNIVTTGGTRESYQRDGFNRFSLGEFLYPFEQTARLCKMSYLPPFAVQGTYRMKPDELSRQASAYRRLLERIAAGLWQPEEMEGYPLLNDWLAALDEEQRP